MAKYGRGLECELDIDELLTFVTKQCSCGAEFYWELSDLAEVEVDGWVMCPSCSAMLDVRSEMSVVGEW